MTQTFSTRKEEIQAIWEKYQGLYVVVGILIGILLFPFLEMVISDLSDLLIGLIPEAIGIGFTVFFLDRIYQKRDIETLKKRLVREAGSQSNETAKAAIAWLNYEGWLNGTKDGLLQGADLSEANLKETNLNTANLQGANLLGVHLERANLNLANLKKSILVAANLQASDLMFVNLQEAILEGANLKQANLEYANLQGANLGGVNLLKAKLKKANLQDIIWEFNELGSTYTAILPNGHLWTPDTDMKRFTDPDHPNFWQPPEKE